MNEEFLITYLVADIAITYMCMLAKYENSKLLCNPLGKQNKIWVEYNLNCSELNIHKN